VEWEPNPEPIPIGTWETLQEGRQAAVLAVGPMVQTALQAADLLKREGIAVRVVNARFIKPLDERMLDRLARERLPLLVLEEGAVHGGLGSAVLEYYAQTGQHHVRVQLMGVPDRFIEHASIAEQREETGLTAENVAARLRSALVLARQAVQ